MLEETITEAYSSGSCGTRAAGGVSDDLSVLS